MLLSINLKSTLEITHLKELLQFIPVFFTTVIVNMVILKIQNLLHTNETRIVELLHNSENWIIEIFGLEWILKVMSFQHVPLDQAAQSQAGLTLGCLESPTSPPVP